jgi:hypothetical protein
MAHKKLLKTSHCTTLRNTIKSTFSYIGIFGTAQFDRDLEAGLADFPVGTNVPGL